jgi:hypothetical protein
MALKWVERSEAGSPRLSWDRRLWALWTDASTALKWECWSLVAQLVWWLVESWAESWGVLMAAKKVGWRVEMLVGCWVALTAY